MRVGVEDLVVVFLSIDKLQLIDSFLCLSYITTMVYIPDIRRIYKKGLQ